MEFKTTLLLSLSCSAMTSLLIGDFTGTVKCISVARYFWNLSAISRKKFRPIRSKIPLLFYDYSAAFITCSCCCSCCCSCSTSCHFQSSNIHFLSLVFRYPALEIASSTQWQFLCTTIWSILWKPDGSYFAPFYL